MNCLRGGAVGERGPARLVPCIEVASEFEPPIRDVARLPADVGGSGSLSK